MSAITLIKSDKFWSFESGFDFCKQAAVFYSHSLHSFNNYLLSTYCIPGLAPNPGDAAVNKINIIPALTAFSVYLRKMRSTIYDSSTS